MPDTTSPVSGHDRDYSGQRPRKVALQPKALINALPDGVVVVDAADHIVFVNNRIEALSGFRPSDLVGRRTEHILPGISPGFVPAHERGDGTELSLRRQDGTLVAVEVEVGELELGEQTLLVASVRDISHRLGGDAALMEKETDFRTTLEGSPAVVVTLAKDGVITWANRAWTEMTGLSRAHWTGRHIVEAWHPNDIAGGLRGLRRVVDDNQSEPLATMRILTASGQYRTFESAMVRLTYKGRVHGAMSIGRDVTGRRAPGETTVATRPDEEARPEIARRRPVPISTVEPATGSNRRRLRVRKRRDGSERLAELRRDLAIEAEPSSTVIGRRDFSGPAPKADREWKPVAKGTWRVSGDGR